MLRHRLGINLLVGDGKSLTSLSLPTPFSFLSLSLFSLKPSLSLAFISIMSLLTFTIPILSPIPLQQGAERASCCVVLSCWPITPNQYIFAKKKKNKIICKNSLFQERKKTPVSWPLIQYTNRRDRRKIKQVNLNATENISKVISQEHKYFLP